MRNHENGYERLVSMTLTESGQRDFVDTSRLQEYGPDVLSTPRTVVGIIAAALGGAVFTLGCWFALKNHAPAGLWAFQCD